VVAGNNARQRARLGGRGAGRDADRRRGLAQVLVGQVQDHQRLGGVVLPDQRVAILCEFEVDQLHLGLKQVIRS
jgi:hypothetical protein